MILDLPPMTLDFCNTILLTMQLPINGLTTSCNHAVDWPYYIKLHGSCEFMIVERTLVDDKNFRNFEA